MRRGRSDSRQRHRPVGFAAECDGLEDPRCTRTIGNASRLAPGLRGRAGDKLQGQASSVDVWHGSQSKRHLDIFQELPPLWHRKTEYQPALETAALMLGSLAQVSWVLYKDKVEIGNSPLRMFRLMVLVVREILFPILDFISCFPSHAGVAPIWPFENRQFNWGRLWSFSCKVHWRRPETITRPSQTEDS